MRAGWRDPWANDATVIEVSPVLRTHGMHRVDLSFRAAIEPTLAQLRHGMQVKLRWTDGAITKTGQALDQAFTAAPEWGPGQVFFHPQRLSARENSCDRRRRCPPDPCVADVAVAASSRLFAIHRAMHDGLRRTPCGGYKLASPTTPVCAFVGDAGLEMGLGELATVRDMKLPVIICVLVDESLGTDRAEATQQPT